MPKAASARVPIWKKVTTATARRRKRYLVGSGLVVSLFLVLASMAAYKGGWWTQILDWAVVAIPAIAGFVAWIIPVKQTTSFHRFWLFVGGVIFSSLVYLQQWETGITHAKEIAKLATKEDLAKLPTVQQIGIEFRKATAEQTVPQASEAKKNTPNIHFKCDVQTSSYS